MMEGDDTRYPISVDTSVEPVVATMGGDEYRVETDWKLGEPLFKAVINGQAVCIQVDRDGWLFRMFHRGAEKHAYVVTPRTAELSQHMLVKEPADLSKFLLSPMPGLLVKLNVKEGDQVKAGEEVAVVEAMKMENSLRAISDGVVKTVSAAAGDSLKVDQPIIEFE